MGRRAAFGLIGLALAATLSPTSNAGAAEPTGASDRRDETSVVAVMLSSYRALRSARYELTFKTGATGALDPGDTITITAPLGTEFIETMTGWEVAAGDNGTPVRLAGVIVRPHGPEFTDNQAELTLAGSVGSASLVRVTALWVTNPGPSRSNRITVATSAQPKPTRSRVYEIIGTGRVLWGSYTDRSVPMRCWGSGSGSDCPTRNYMLYVPAGQPSGLRPLLVDLHGCFNTPATEARLSRFNEVAGARGFVVLYPQQSLAANGGQCWNWFDDAHWHRGRGEPAIIAAITRRIMDRFNIDPSRVYVSGISAGAGMSGIMAVTYPDLFAAAAIYAGCEYQGLPCFTSVAAQPPPVSALAAIAEMGPRLRSVPIFAISGDIDPIVPVANSEQLVQQWVSIAAHRRTGSVGIVPQLPSESRTEEQPGRKPATVDVWRDRAGCLVAQRWVVHGMHHQWAGATPDGSPRDMQLADPNAPDVTTAIVEFLSDHPMLREHDKCGP